VRTLQLFDSAKEEDRFSREIRQVHDAAQNRLTGRSYSQAGRESGASFATCRQANGGDLLTIAKRHPGERLDKIREPLGKNLPFTVRITTGEFTNGKAKLNRTACAGHIA
jgi:hypothetical protein